MAKARWMRIVGGAVFGVVAVAVAVTAAVPGSVAQGNTAAADDPEDHLGGAAIGQQIVGFSIFDVDGEKFDLDHLRGEPHVLLLVAADCPWSRRTLERLMAVLERHEAMQAVVAVFKPERDNRGVPSAEVAARTLAREVVMTSPAHERVRVGTSADTMRRDLGYLFSRTGDIHSIDEFPALFAADGRAIVRGVTVGDASHDAVAQAVAAALGESDDE